MTDNSRVNIAGTDCQCGSKDCTASTGLYCKYPSSASVFVERSVAGYCSDWRYAKSGTQSKTSDGEGYVTTPWDTPLLCMQRCKDLFPDTTAFYMINGNQCGCSVTTSGACSLIGVLTHLNYKTYETGEGALSSNECSARPPVVCTVIDGSTSNTAGVDCQCGSYDCTDRTGKKEKRDFFFFDDLFFFF